MKADQKNGHENPNGAENNEISQSYISGNPQRRIKLLCSKVTLLSKYSESISLFVINIIKLKYRFSGRRKI